MVLKNRFIFSGCSTQHVCWLQHTAHSMFSDQESNLHPLLWKCRVLTTGLPGKSLEDILTFSDFCLQLAWGLVETSVCPSTVHFPSFLKHQIVFPSTQVIEECSKAGNTHMGAQCWLEFYFLKLTKTIPYLIRKIQHNIEKKRGRKLTFAECVLCAKFHVRVYFNIKLLFYNF